MSVNNNRLVLNKHAIGMVVVSIKNSDFNANQVKQELAQLAYEKDENYWTLNRDEYPGLEKVSTGSRRRYDCCAWNC